jgi:hypothetical protein
MIGVGAVGYGYWGPNPVRSFAESADTRIIGVAIRLLDAANLSVKDRWTPSADPGGGRPIHFLKR